MNLASVLHKPMSEYAFAVTENTYIFRLRTGRDVCTSVRFGYADRATMDPKLAFSVVDMERVSNDILYDYYEVRLYSEYDRIAYYFELSDDNETVYYLGDCFEQTWDVERSDYFQLPFNHKADRIEVPEWVKEAIVYNIFPDSFASGYRTICGTPGETVYDGVTVRSKLGGTIRGIRDNLDYIQDLGFNCIYLNPFFVADSYHKYDLIDYFHVDPMRGTDTDFKELVKKAHEMGMRVIIDGVFNHISKNHPFFRDVCEYGRRSKYFDCFYNLGSDNVKIPEAGEKPAYTCFAYVPEMPKTDTSNKFLAEYFCRVGAYWIEEFDVDGWRLDVANEVDDTFLRDFRKTVKASKKDAVVIGEVWENASHYVNGNMLDGAMNYDFRRYAGRYIAQGGICGEEFLERMNTMFFRYPMQALHAQLNLLDSHDVSRFMSLCGGDKEKYKLAAVLLMTMPGMPCVFYGDEQGLCGVAESEYRRPMNFEGDGMLADFYKELIKIRHNHNKGNGGFLCIPDGRIEIPYGSFGVYINTTDKPYRMGAAHGEVLLKKGFDCGILEPMGYVITEINGSK